MNPRRWIVGPLLCVLARNRRFLHPVDESPKRFDLSPVLQILVFSTTVTEKLCHSLFISLINYLRCIIFFKPVHYSPFPSNPFLSCYSVSVFLGFLLDLCTAYELSNFRFCKVIRVHSKRGLAYFNAYLPMCFVC